ncbi:RNA-directed DNA polymerase, eukaryota, Reverse transcriptase zinc-binding domain protein [Artemisia annua]|uniref:RNA-directed DNA polymerase, eukaryota, Reverse transcriptase zinc-binding domain protein n=1 Tax=Artemisia annua TaxID=35608 RepID=A0A2U1LG08_ARTAN|nr:RNA-directed DNA polymerase, eukaryota, Reverse transcriptase zinc-binding domain protein [Artemisia annua]
MVEVFLYEPVLTEDKEDEVKWLSKNNGKPKIQDRLMKWQPNTDFKCALCKNDVDSHTHMFFKCKYYEQVWAVLKKLTSIGGSADKLMDIVNMLTSKPFKNNIWMVVNRLVIGACVYHVWEVKVLLRIIVENVREKLMSSCVKKSIDVCNVAIAGWILVDGSMSKMYVQMGCMDREGIITVWESCCFGDIEIVGPLVLWMMPFMDSSLMMHCEDVAAMYSKDYLH